MTEPTKYLPPMTRSIEWIADIVCREIGEAHAAGALPGARDFEVTCSGSRVAPRLEVVVRVYPGVEGDELAKVRAEATASIELWRDTSLSARERLRSDAAFEYTLVAV